MSRIVQQVVDQVGQVGDVENAVLNHVGIGFDKGGDCAAQQAVGQRRSVTDVDYAVTVHVAHHGLLRLGEHDGVELGPEELGLLSSAVVLDVAKVSPAVNHVIHVKLYNGTLAGFKRDDLVLALNAGARVIIDVLVQFHRYVLVVGRRAGVGDGQLQAELVTGDDMVAGIGDVEHLGGSAQARCGHRVDGQRAGGDGIAAVVVPGPGERVGACIGGHEAIGDVAGLTGAQVDHACRLEGTVNKHVEQSGAPLAVVGQVDVDVDRTAVVQQAFGSDVIDGVVERRGTAIARDGARVAVDDYLEIILVGTDTGTPVAGVVLAIDGQDAVSAVGEAATELQRFVA